MVRAKFKVISIKITEGRRDKIGPDEKPLKDGRGWNVTEPCPQWTIEACPVYANGDPNHENTKFWQASPSGKFELNCVNPEAVKLFEVGKEFYLDMTPA